MSLRPSPPSAGPAGAAPAPDRAAPGRTLLAPIPGPAPSEPAPYRRLGTFTGVFVPVVLSVIGVVMFMRAGTVVGYAGLWLSLLVLLLSVAIVTLTTLSLSAIATNLDLRAGGIYFMVSRVLGPDFGGSIGITLYLALAVNVAFHTIGFSEAFFGLVGEVSPAASRTARALWLPQIVSTLVVTGLFVLTYRGTTQAIKAQTVVFALVMLSVLAFLVGGLGSLDEARLSINSGPSFTVEVGFWTTFALFFPMAAGISSGAHLSGDLERPARAIPLGTLLAIGFTTALFAAELVLLAARAAPAGRRDAAPFATARAASAGAQASGSR